MSFSLRHTSRRRARLASEFLLLILGTHGHALARPANSTKLLNKRDQTFLQDLTYRCFLYFWEQADPNTGLVLDRARVNGQPEPGFHRSMASISATGFGLTALCIGAEKGWIPESMAHQRVRSSLEFLANHVPTVHGWYYHWLDRTTGERMVQSEVSSIDTALLLAGVLTVRERYARDREIRDLADLIYHRVDFHWMLNGDPYLLSHGWTPERGFLHSRWDNYSELTILYLLAVGSPLHPIDPRSWYAWRRPILNYDGYSYVSGGPLFTHQYSHAWVDFRNRRDDEPSGLDYFLNSVVATRATREFCIQLNKAFPDSYSKEIWGVSASDSAHGYLAWGEPQVGPILDGTLVPSAAGGSLMFTPRICLEALQNMKARFGGRIFGRYGFVDAFNPSTGWVDPDVIAEDLGITLLSAENLRSGMVWRWFMRNPSIRRSLNDVHLYRVTLARKAWWRARRLSRSLGSRDR